MLREAKGKFLVVLTAVFFILTGVSYAATFTVNNLNDSGAGSLRQAILDANANMNGPGVVDEIVFQAGLTGIIPTGAGVDNVFSGQMTIDDDVTITGPGADVITIDAQMVSRILNINDGAGGNQIVVSISGLRFMNGQVTDTDGGAIDNREELSIDSCVFEDNIGITIGSPTQAGGAIFNRANGTITAITHSTFSGNMAGSSGGAIFNDGGTIIEITGSTFSGNTTGTSGGAISNAIGSTITTIAQSTFNGNTSNLGGAIFNDGFLATIATIEQIDNSTFSGNSASDDGGAIWNAGSLNISFTTIANNMAGDGGGGIFRSGGTLNIRNSIVAFNTATVSGPNCNQDIANEAGNETNNYSDDASCGFGAGGDTQVFVLDPLGDNGGGTQTRALVSGPPLDGASAACDKINDLGMAVPNDQRFFPRPEPSGTDCDSGAFEAQPSGKLTIVKEAAPPGSTGFEFLGTSFLEGCGLNGAFFLDDGEMEMCVLPPDTYSVEEGLFPDGFVLLDIMCTETPSAETPTSVTIDIADGDDVTCTFRNSSLEVKITKLTIPAGGTDFPFTSTGFTGLLDCDITDAFMLDDMQMASCIVPLGDYTVTEAIPDGQVLAVLCNDLPEVFTIDALTGTLEFTVAEEGDDVDCIFINSFAGTLLRIMDEPAGANCEFGGTKIESGLDTNQNGVLDDGEVIADDTVFVCNGAPGEQGPPGPPGLNSLVNVTPEPPGPDNCEFGGIKVETGLDDNENGMLDVPDEVDSTAFVCNGAPGDNTLVRVTPEAPGGNCAFGGFKIDTGVDDNTNGVLDDPEIDNTFFICQGAPGDNSLIDVNVELPGANCIFGGVRVDSGVDDNANGALDPAEVDDTSFICNGQPGAQGIPGIPGPPGEPGGLTLIDIVPIPGGEGSQCPEGGLMILTGPDTNDNGVLDENEVTDTSIVCSSQDGDGFFDGGTNTDGGSNGDNGNGCSGNTLAGGGPEGMDAYAELLVILLMPFVLAIGRRMKRGPASLKLSTYAKASADKHRGKQGS